MLKLRFNIILFILFAGSVCNHLYAQGCFDDYTDDELLDNFMEIKRLQNKAGEENMDSLYAANKKFLSFLVYQGERNYTIMSDESRFVYQGMDFSVSDDYKCNIFSWDMYSYQNMHQRYGVLFYKTSDGIRSIQYTNGVAPYRVKDIHLKNGKTVYLLFFEDDYSPSARFRRVTANIIEAYGPNEIFMPKPVFCETAKDSSSFIEYTYNLGSYSTPRIMPAIILSSDKKKISLPVVNKDGSFEGKYKVYFFDGHKYILTPTHN